MKNRTPLTLAFMLALVTSQTAAAEASERFNYYCAKPDVDTSVSLQVGEAIRVTPKAGSMNLIASVKAPDPSLVAIFAQQFEVDTQCAEFLLANGAETDEDGVLARVYFQFDSSQLTPQSVQVLDKIAAIGRQTQQPFQLEGHTDAIGARDYNFSLGLKRSAQVKQYLAERGVMGQQMKAVSFGETQPINENADATQHEQNRRVDIKHQQP